MQVLLYFTGITHSVGWRGID